MDALQVQKNKAKTTPQDSIPPVLEAPQPGPMYTALMNRLDAMDGMLAKMGDRECEKREGTTETKEGPIEGGKGSITRAGFQGAI